MKSNMDIPVSSSSQTDIIVSASIKSVKRSTDGDRNERESSSSSLTQRKFQQQQQLQQVVIEAEHESLGMELAGELDAVLKTEMKMREVAEIMALFR